MVVVLWVNFLEEEENHVVGGSDWRAPASPYSRMSRLI